MSEQEYATLRVGLVVVVPCSKLLNYVIIIYLSIYCVRVVSIGNVVQETAASGAPQEGMSTKRSVSQRRRQRRTRQRLRAMKEDVLRSFGGGQLEGRSLATEATPPRRLVAHVLPTPVVAPDRLLVSTTIQYFTPMAELSLHPQEIDVPPERPQVSRYLYLTRDFLDRHRRGFYSNPIELIQVTIPQRN